MIANAHIYVAVNNRNRDFVAGWSNFRLLQQTERLKQSASLPSSVSSTNRGTELEFTDFLAWLRLHAFGVLVGFKLMIIEQHL